MAGKLTPGSAGMLSARLNQGWMKFLTSESLNEVNSKKEPSGEHHMASWGGVSTSSETPGECIIVKDIKK